MNNQGGSVMATEEKTHHMEPNRSSANDSSSEEKIDEETHHNLIHSEADDISDASFNNLKSDMTQAIRRIRRNSLGAMLEKQDSLRWGDDSPKPEEEKAEKEDSPDPGYTFQIPGLLLSQESMKDIRRKSRKSHISAESPRYVFQDQTLMSKNQFESLKDDMLSEIQRLHSGEMNRMFQKQESQWLTVSEPVTPNKSSPEGTPDVMRTIHEHNFQLDADISDLSGDDDVVAKFDDDVKTNGPLPQRKPAVGSRSRPADSGGKVDLWLIVVICLGLFALVLAVIWSSLQRIEGKIDAVTELLRVQGKCKTPYE